MARKAKMWRTAIIDSYAVRNEMTSAQLAKILGVSLRSYYRHRESNWSTCDIGRYIKLVERLRMSADDERIAIFGKETT